MTSLTKPHAGARQRNSRPFVVYWVLAGAVLLCSFAVLSVSSQHCPSDSSLATCTAPQASAEEPSDTAKHSPPNYIVRFHSYLGAEEHRMRLQSALGAEGDDWRWLARDNPAYLHPTDFGLLWLKPSRTDSLIAQLGEQASVRSVHADRRITNALKVVDDGLLSGAASSQAGEQGMDEQELAAGLGSGTQRDILSVFTTEKRNGRLTTRSTFDLDENQGALDDAPLQRPARRLLDRNSFTAMLAAERLWQQGFTGKGVHVGVFDTGIREGHPHIRNIRERTNWTHQDSLSDGLGHGSFVAGVIGSQDTSCPGLAPDVELHTFKVFTDDQVSYTSWFLDAFNYAMVSGINVINLSIGGPDYLDAPFVDKVLEITSNGILLVSAIGNDGPLYGTLNNPADQNDVIGVGGVDYYDSIAGFSSRGMSTWELPLGYGRAKPDVMAYSRDVHGSRIQGGCRSLSGTSVASPVVTGAVCLLASTVPADKRWSMLNPASMKQALVEGAVRLPNLNIYEQGAGRINLHNTMAILSNYTARASLHPAALDFTACPYMWPFCTQPLYATAQPLIFNATVLNAMHVTGNFSRPPTFTPADDDGGKHLRMHFEHAALLWPWSGYLAVFITVSSEGASYSGNASGTIRFTVASPGPDGVVESEVEVPVKVAVVPTPPRDKRVLWDQFHSIKYPPAYIPRDNLEIKTDILDWHGDHLHTNYHDMFNFLRGAGYFVEILGSPFTCFDAANYGALLLVDAEEEYYPEEVAKLAADVRERGLALLVFAEWYNARHMVQMRFFDDNTRSWWTPVVGGANVPALNDLLAPFNISLGDAVISGDTSAGGHNLHILSGTNLLRFPAGGHLTRTRLTNAADNGATAEFGTFGFLRAGSGTVAAYGDSNCLDSSHQSRNCYNFLVELLGEATAGGAAGRSGNFEDDKLRLAEAFGEGAQPPERRADVNLTDYSVVLRAPLQCYSNSGCAQPDATGCRVEGGPGGPRVREVKVASAGQGAEQQQQQTADAADGGGGKEGADGDAAGAAPGGEAGAAGGLGTQLKDGIVKAMAWARWLAVGGVVAVVVLWQLAGHRRRAAPPQAVL